MSRNTVAANVTEYRGGECHGKAVTANERIWSSEKGSMVDA
jgi:hypothetical protein